MFSICIFAVVILPLVTAPSSNALWEDYGRYNAYVRNVTQCGDDKGYLALVTCKGRQNMIADYHVPYDVGPLMLKMASWKLSGSEFVPLTRFTTSKPCQHFFFGAAFRQFGNLTDKCHMKKGTYHVTAPTNETVHGMFGEKFFRGVFRMRIQVYARRTSIVCEKFETEFNAV